MLKAFSFFARLTSMKFLHYCHQDSFDGKFLLFQNSSLGDSKCRVSSNDDRCLCVRHWRQVSTVWTLRDSPWWRVRLTTSHHAPDTNLTNFYGFNKFKYLKNRLSIKVQCLMFFACEIIFGESCYICAH